MWMKIDDRLHAHRKTRKVIRSGDDKGRDIAPMGLWVIAGSWASQNGTDGWVPEHELDRWDDDWDDLASRLVKAGYWWPEQHEGEPGFGFVDWEDYNPVSNASQRGSFGNHVRWHVNAGVVNTDCEHCPQEPVDESSIAPESLSDRTAIDSDIAPDSLNVALPGPEPRPDPDPKDSCASDDAQCADADAQSAHDDAQRADPLERFPAFWDVYGKKVDRKRAEQKWKAALKKRGVTPDLLIERAAAYVARQQAAGKHPEFTKNPDTWLNGENWNDEANNVTQLRADRPRRNGLAFVPTCPTCGAPPENVHDPECPDQSWRPNTEGIGL